MECSKGKYLTNGPLTFNVPVVRYRSAFPVQAPSGMKHTKHRVWRYLTIATIVFFLGAGTWFFIMPIQQSKRLEHSLIDRFDWATRYTPPVDGVIQPDRLERFIKVRQAVQANCRTFQTIMDNVIRLETLESDPNLSASQKISEGFDSLKSMFSAAPAFLEFMDARNASLLTEEMGLGEYIYVYLAAYGELLAQESQGRYADQEDAYISPRARKEYVQILGNQLAALQAGDHDQDAASLALIADLQAEIAALEDGSHSSPWPDGPPARTGESLAPYRDRLSALYCLGIVRVEILQKNKGYSFEG
jgi:hypothetical protein